MIQLDKEFTTTEAAEGGAYEPPPAGGYTFQVVDVSEEPSQAGNDMVTLSLDIADGPHEGAFERFPRKVFQLVNGDNLPYFKGMLEKFKACNSKQKLQNLVSKDLRLDASQLKGCLIGGSLRQAEYLDKNSGEVKIGMEVGYLCTLEDLATLKPQPIKKLPARRDTATAGRPGYQAPRGGAQAGYKPPEEDDLPF